MSQPDAMDSIYIKGLRIDTVIGVHAFERQLRQTLVLDLEMTTDISAAAQHDDLTQTLDYGAIAERATAVVRDSEFKLIETLAEHLSQLLLEEFTLTSLTLKIGKPGAVAAAEDVGVVIHRTAIPVETGS